MGKCAVLVVDILRAVEVKDCLDIAHEELPEASKILHRRLITNSLLAIPLLLYS